MIHRHISLINKKLLDDKYKDLVNASNIASIKKRELKKIFKDENGILRNKYLHNVIDEGVESVEDKDLLFLRKVRRVIKRCGLTLSEVEEHNLFLLEEQIFSIDRHIKMIDVDFKLYKRETIGVKFTNAQLFIKEGELLKKMAKGDLLISNKRIFVLDGEFKFIKRFTEVTKQEADDRGGGIKTKDKKQYLIRIHDQVTLKNTVNNIMGS